MEAVVRHVWQGGGDANDTARLAALTERFPPAPDPNRRFAPTTAGSACTPRCTKRMCGRLAASQIAAASLESTLPAWPSLRYGAARKAETMHASNPIASSLRAQWWALKLHAWHAALFPTGYSGMTKIRVGSYREHGVPIQPKSGSYPVAGSPVGGLNGPNVGAILSRT
jgi:hypothetical protein